MKDFLEDKIFCFEGLLSGLIVTAVSTIIFVMPKHDAPGFEVSGPQNGFYECTEIKQDAVDVRLATSTSVDEVNKICDKQRNTSK